MKHVGQKGVAPIILLVGVMGVIAFLAISSSAPFKNNLLSSLFPKDQSFAATSTPAPSVTPGVGGVFQEANGLVSMEAENYKTNISRGGHQWVNSTSTQWGNFGGTGFMDAQPYNAVVNTTGFTTTSPELQYDINFQTTGTYYIWTRGRGDGVHQVDYAIHGGLDGQPLSTATEMGSHSPNVWEWLSNRLYITSRATVTITTPGVHTLHIWMDYDGFKLDQIMLRQNPDTGFSFYNQSVNPVESPRTPITSPAPTASPSPVPSSSAKPGDIDGNNKVDIFDYNILLTNFGKNGSGIQGDLDHNNKVDIFDFNILLTNFGK